MEEEVLTFDSVLGQTPMLSQSALAMGPGCGNTDKESCCFPEQRCMEGADAFRDLLTMA
jgi:hypothetical protein